MIDRNGKPGAPLVPRCQVFPFRSIPLLLRRAGLDPWRGLGRVVPLGLFSRRSTSPGTVPPGAGNRWEELLEEQPLTPPVPEPTAAEAAPSPRGVGGRPVAVEPRTRRVSMSLTEAEHRAWTEAAGGQRLSVWARERVQEQLDAESPRVGEVRELARIRADLARVGSNLNQLMRAVNQGQVVPTPQLYEAVDALASQLGAVRRELP